jgi:hypothetical protein
MTRKQWLEEKAQTRAEVLYLIGLTALAFFLLGLSF